MDIFPIVGFGIMSTIIIVILRVQKPEIAVQASLAAGIIMCILIVNKLSSIVRLILDYFRKIDVNTVHLVILFKIVAVAYIVEFAASICKDAGESSIASKIELAGKVVIVMLAIPIITSMLDIIIKVMP